MCLNRLVVFIILFPALGSTQVTSKDISKSLQEKNSSQSVKEVILRHAASESMDFSQFKRVQDTDGYKKTKASIDRFVLGYQNIQYNTALGSGALRFSFDMISGSIAIAAGSATGPMAPIVAKSVNYVVDKSLGYVVDLYEETAQGSAENYLKNSIRKHLDRNGVEQLVALQTPKERVEYLKNKGFLPEIHIDDNLDANGQKVVMGAMIKEVGKLSKQNLEELARQKDQIDDISDDVKKLKTLGQALWKSVEDNQKRLGKIESNLNYVNNEVKRLNNKVDRNSHDIEYLQNFMFGKMTAKERIDALNSGFFPKMDAAKRADLEAKLMIESRRQEIISDINEHLGTAGDLANIATNLGIKDPILQDIGNAVTAGTYIMQGVSALGSPMGWVSAASSFSNVLGIGKPDIGASRHAQVMKALGRILENQGYMLKSLQRIEERQVEMLNNQRKILQSIIDLSKQVQQNYDQHQKDIYTVLKEVKVLNEGLSELMRREYKSCFDLTTPNRFSIDSIDNYNDLRTKFRDYSSAFSPDFPDCLKGLSNAIRAGGGDFHGAFSAQFRLPTDDSDYENLSSFLKEYWPKQMQIVTDQIIPNNNIEFRDLFAASSSPTFYAEQLDTLFRKHISTFTMTTWQRDLNSLITPELMETYYSKDAIEEISEVYFKFYKYYSLISRNASNELMTLPELLEVDNYNEPSFIDLTHLLLRIDIFLFQQHLLSGALLMPYYYDIFMSEDQKLLKSKQLLYDIIKGNTHLQYNLILYILQKELQETKSTIRKYQFAINTEKGEDWLLNKVVSDMSKLKFKWQNDAWIKANGFNEKVNWTIQIDNPDPEVTETIFIQLPESAELKQGLLRYQDDLYTALQVRKKAGDLYYWSTMYKSMRANEKRALAEALLSDN